MSNIFSSINPEKLKIYQEVEKHYIIEDIARQINENIISPNVSGEYIIEDIPDQVWDLCKLEAIYNDWLANNDANLSYWDNINTAIEVILSEKDCQTIIKTFQEYLNTQNRENEWFDTIGQAISQHIPNKNI